MVRTDSPTAGLTRESLETRGGRYSWARYYHPGRQRFISEDPLNLASGDVNLYAYVWNAPPGYRDPAGLWGIGVTGNASATAGLGFVGVAATASAGSGIFWGGSSGVNVGGFASAGGFAGGPGYGSGYPSSQDNAAFGAYAGAGVGGFFTNATKAEDLRGPFTTISADVALPFLPGFSFQFGYSQGTWIASLTAGPSGSGLGLGLSIMQTNTIANTWARSCSKR